MENKSLIYTTNKEHLALLISDRLKNESIEVVVLSHDDPISETAGVYEIYVDPSDVEKAEAIIKESND